jgi:hypothetical protein
MNGQRRHKSSPFFLQAQQDSAQLWMGRDFTKYFHLKEIIFLSRDLRYGHFDFGRDRDGMDLKTAVSGRDRKGWNFLGIVLGFLGIFRD